MADSQVIPANEAEELDDRSGTPVSPATRPPLSVFGRRDSLVRQASVDRLQNEGIKRRNTIRNRKELEKKSVLSKQLLQLLNDEGMDLIKNCSEDMNSSVDEQHNQLHLSIIINCSVESRNVLSSAMQKLLNAGITLNHIETRPDKGRNLFLFLRIRTFICRLPGPQMDVFDALTKLVIDKQQVLERIQLSRWRQKRNKSSGNIWYPKHVSELDLCAHVVVKYEPTEDPKHPGYGDAAYIARRAELNDIANTYRYGDSMPLVEYSKEENRTWQLAYTQLKLLRKTHTCSEYQHNVDEMEKAGVITGDKIPQLRELNLYIQRKTGFELRPCGGLLSARDFLASLAFRVFQATLYVRHGKAPHHCPEPDVIHEILGHCPMFADPDLAQMSQEIGLLSLGASDEQIERLSTVYWFIVEFGLCRQEGSLKAIGAGLISAYGELQHACSNVPNHEDFVPEVTALRSYEDSDYQPLYFVAESIRDAMQRLRVYARKLCPSTMNIYRPLTRTVQQLSLGQSMQIKLSELQVECKEMSQLIEDFNKDTVFTDSIK
uniref:Biopterin-dependent aromatic amino acid hydroxylase family profile domain-containing protein n=1 Tax=Ditylenchus dipsaci TaxID=166011 RepID=A0A915DYW4_9BILA